MPSRRSPTSPGPVCPLLMETIFFAPRAWRPARVCRVDGRHGNARRLFRGFDEVPHSIGAPGAQYGPATEDDKARLGLAHGSGGAQGARVAVLELRPRVLPDVKGGEEEGHTVRGQFVELVGEDFRGKGRGRVPDAGPVAVPLGIRFLGHIASAAAFRMGPMLDITRPEQDDRRRASWRRWPAVGDPCVTSPWGAKLAG